MLLLVFAAAIRAVRLGQPDELIFDETYYAKDACLYLGHSPESCDLDRASEQTYVHPPLGKWMIALGIRLFGYNPFGWRISAVVAGTLLVLVTFLIAEKLFRSRTVGLLAGLLVATDFLLIVQSRIAMLDIFLALLVAVGLLFVVLDRERVLRIRSHLRRARPGPPPERMAGYRMAAGLAFGMALAVKWSAVYALAAGGLLTLVWTVGLQRVRRAAVPGSSRLGGLSPIRQVMVSVVAFGLVPLIVYLGAYTDRFVGDARTDCAYAVPAAGSDRYFSDGVLGLTEGECIGGIPGAALSLADLHERIARYHLNLEAEHPYQSRAWTWPLVLRPVAYYYQGSGGRAAEVIGMANVAVWYAALAAGIWLLVRSRRTWRPERVVAAAWAVQYLPWLLVERPLFFFYMTPAVPFMMIALAAALAALARRGLAGRILVVGFLLAGVGAMLVLFYPVLTAVEIDFDHWRSLMWYPHFECGDLRCGWI